MADAPSIENVTDKVNEEKLAELEASLSSETEAWQPENGEVLSGTITNIETRGSKYGKYPAVTVRKSDGTELVFHAYRTVALNELLRIKPEVGDLIAIAYQTPDKEHDYHNYVIRVSRELGNDYAWGQFTPKERPGASD